MGPKIQYATQSIDPLEIRVYKGQDASFTLYEDEGDTYNYESGQYARITFDWKDSAQQLTIGARSGTYGRPATGYGDVVESATESRRHDAKAPGAGGGETEPRRSRHGTGDVVFPEGSPGGGQLVAQGTPEDVAKIAASHTGQFLRKVL
jgi:hypothetical protein